MQTNQYEHTQTKAAAIMAKLLQDPKGSCPASESNWRLCLRHRQPLPYPLAAPQTVLLHVWSTQQGWICLFLENWTTLYIHLGTHSACSLSSLIAKKHASNSDTLVGLDTNSWPLGTV